MQSSKTTPTLTQLMRTLKVNPDIKFLNLDLAWCLITIVGTTLLSLGLVSGAIGNSTTIGAVWSGALSAIVYLQGVSIAVYALSYCSISVRGYRNSIIALAVIFTYLVTKLVVIPEPSASIYAYSASLTAIMVIIVKVKSLLYILADNLESVDGLVVNKL